MIAIGARAVAQEPAGSHDAVVCTAGGELAERYEWRVEKVTLPTEAATRAINSRIRREALRNFPVPKDATARNCRLPRQGPFFMVHSLYCEPMLVSPSFVSMSCADEGNTAGKTGVSRFALNFRFSQSGQPIPITSMFRNPASAELMREALEAVVRAQHGAATTNDRNFQIGIDEIPGISYEMLRSMTFTLDGVYFVGFGTHHSAFKTTFAYAAVRKWLSEDVVRAIESNRASR